jgi:hypothetical protein
VNDYDLPPGRHHVEGIIDIAPPHYQRSSVEDLTVDCSLLTKPAKAVTVGLDLVSVQQA